MGWQAIPEKLKLTADYAWNVGATQYVNAFFPGSLQPKLGIHTVGAALRYRF